MARNLDIATLRSLVSVAEAGGVTRAAQRLHLTQSAVSMQIKRLEDSLGLPLLDRSGRKVTPTPEGDQLLTYARRMVALNDEAIDRMVAPEFEGEISFGIPCDLMHPHAPRILRRFDQDFPRVHIRVVSAFTYSLLEDFHAGRLDVILTTEDTESSDAETLTQKPLLWFGAPGARAWTKEPLPFASTRHCAFRPASIAALEAHDIAWRSAVDTHEESSVVASVAADLCIMSLLEGAYPDTLAPVAHGGKLPDLPTFSINMYLAGDGPAAGLTGEFARYVRDTFRN